MVSLSKSILPLVGRLIVIIDPIGNIPLFIALLHAIKPKRARRIIAREMAIALIIMGLFGLCGAQALSAIGVDRRSIGVSGGMILFIIALKMLFPSPNSEDVSSSNDEPFLFPLAVPLVAGPSMLVTMIDLGKKFTPNILFSALFIAWLFSTAILMTAGELQRLLGPYGISACERVMGLVLALLSAQMFLSGLSDYFSMTPPPPL